MLTTIVISRTDLLPLNLEQAFVDEMMISLPELPDARKARFISDYGLSAYDASVLVAERETGDYFDAVARGRDAKQAANWVQGELFGRLKKAEISIENSPVCAEALGGLLDLIADETISGRIAKDVFEEMWGTGKGAAEIVEEKGLKQITDTEVKSKLLSIALSTTIKIMLTKFAEVI